jgi:hypothetical protein
MEHYKKNSLTLKGSVAHGTVVLIGVGKFAEIADTTKSELKYLRELI